VPNQMSWVLAEFKESLFEDIQELRSFESSSILLGGNISTKEGSDKDVKRRIGLARGT